VTQASALCFLDVETTGLDEQTDEVLEIGAVFGRFEDGRFNELARYSNVFFPGTAFESWDPIVRNMHSQSGLLSDLMRERGRIESGGRDYVHPGSHAFLERCAERRVLSDETLYVWAHEFFGDAKVVLAGNGVHFDLRFVRRLFPRFASRLSHRVLDTSGIKILLESLGRPFEKREAHRALADCDEAIETLQECAAWIVGRRAGA
jgi:oligoribonuclease (3'-5' exoribonuclease)